MNLGPRLALSSGLVMVALMGGGGILQSSGSVLVSSLENGRQIYRFGVTAEGRMVENSHGMKGVGCVMCHGLTDEVVQCMVFRFPTLRSRF